MPVNLVAPAFSGDCAAFADTLPHTESTVVVWLAPVRLHLLKIGSHPSPQSHDGCAESEKSKKFGFHSEKVVVVVGITCEGIHHKR